MFTRKPRLQLEKFAINGPKRLLQHNRHFATEAKPLSLRSLLGVLRMPRVGRPWVPSTRLTPMYGPAVRSKKILTS